MGFDWKEFGKILLISGVTAAVVAGSVSWAVASKVADKKLNGEDDDSEEEDK